MKKAMMYLLLALGITLGVVFVGGATAGFVAGFIDGLNGDKVGTSSSITYMVGVGSVFVIILCAILQWVFLKLGFASYTTGRIPKSPKSVSWKLYVGMIMAMAGMAVFYHLMLDKDIERGFAREIVAESYSWMHQHLVFSILMLIIIEATANLVIYGAVLRELLEWNWKHRPGLIIQIYAAIMAIFCLINSSASLMYPVYMIAQIEGMMYHYTRSILPIIVGDVMFWIVMLCLVGIPAIAWWFLIVVLVAGAGVYLAFNAMEPYKPID